jgi:Bardet-Biedl syndrome 4 protein
MQNGNHSAAFEQLGTAMAFDPNNAKAMLAAGSMMQSHGDFDVALSKYRLGDYQFADLTESPRNICFPHVFKGKDRKEKILVTYKRADSAV